jgi:hypothetical protein
MFSFRFYIFYGLLCISATLPAQTSPRFGAGLITGLTASQIDGDQSAGYNKLGWQAGLRGLTRLSNRSDLSIEFLYAQRGSQSALFNNNEQFFPFRMTLNYVEIPVQIHYKDWYVEDDKDGFWRVSFNAGFSYARFISAKTGKDGSALYEVVPDYLKKNDISLLLGANFFANRHLGFTFRYVRSLGLMYDYRDWTNPPVDRGWLGHCLYLQGVYMF